MPLLLEPAKFRHSNSRRPHSSRPQSNRFALGLIVGCLMGLSACVPASPSQSDVTSPVQSGSTSAPNTVTILGQFSGKQQEHFEKALVPFEEEQGIDVIYEATDNIRTLLNMRITSFAEPDLVVLPQPGLMADLAREDLLVPLTEVIETKALRQSYTDAWLDLGTVDDVPYGLWYRVSVKSLVWYRPTAFEDKGYDIPRTWAEMIALSDRIVADGGTPWCIGLESGAASGWPGTDWIEDIMLRTAGPEAYRQWISHELPFNSPIVLNAFQEFGKILRNPKYVSGGTAKAISTAYQDSISGIFNTPPDCYLHRQANFISAFLPEDKSPRIDYDAFLLPGITEQFGSPLLVAGDAIAMFHKTPETEKLMQYLASPEPHRIAAQLGGFISPQQQVPLDDYPDLVSQNVAQILANADVIRFDASDMMPGFVGSGAFWTGMMDFAAGKSAEDITKEIDRNWP